MKFKYILSFLLFLPFVSQSQIYNVNPDKDGDPWIIGGLRIPDRAELEKIPVLEIPGGYAAKDLPSYLDNSTNQYFRPVFGQQHGSCAQASGVGYTFTYEINRVRGTSANTSSNQFPSHYTYNFLNGGSGANGSWMNDGWEIIKASGCPTVATYGGMAADETYWMSGYDDYISGTVNRVDEIFSIHVGTAEGLETLKYWLYDHLDGSETGSIVNFAAGISNTNYETSGDKIISWGYPTNHAMTIVGWDDNIEYDFNDDGSITNNVDINNDGTVDMKDWERGAVIMVNSWGPGWMGDGKAYIMYKLLAEPSDNGGIHANKVYAVTVKETQEPQLIMKVKMTHDTRNMIAVHAGISEDVLATQPDHIMDFPLFNKQGGEYDMRGTSSDPIEFALDITPLLNYIESGTNAKYFLSVDEADPFSSGSGMIYDFSVVDASGNETVSQSQNVPITDNDLTLLSLTDAISFESPDILTQEMPVAYAGSYYSYQLEAENGSEPYDWDIMIDYQEESISETYPAIETEQLTPDNNDDGYAVKSIDFDFPFYGEMYNEFTVLTDGSLLFEPGFDYLRTEEAIMNTKMIGVFASDLMIYPADNDGIFYEGNENYASFRWKTSLYDNQAADVDVAVTLYPNGEMKFFYGDGITQGLSWASGVSNGSGSYRITDISGDYDPSNTQLKISAGDFPFGMEVTSDGSFQGTAPEEINTWQIDFKVSDNNNLSDYQTISFTTATSSVEETGKQFISVYPNPFTKTAHIRYSLNETEGVGISIFDINGKEIQKLTDEVQGAGTYSLQWNAANTPSGVYIIKIHIGSRVFEKKAVLLN